VARAVVGEAGGKAGGEAGGEAAGLVVGWASYFSMAALLSSPDTSLPATTAVTERRGLEPTGRAVRRSALLARTTSGILYKMRAPSIMDAAEWRLEGCRGGEDGARGTGATLLVVRGGRHRTTSPAIERRRSP
jgi:hypothetical protein